MIEMHPEVHVALLAQDDVTGFEHLVAMLRGLHAETPHAPLCEERLRTGIQEVLADGFAFLSFSRQGQLAGAVGLAIEGPWFSAERWLIDRWFYVAPAHRRTPHARMLLRACKLTARDTGLPLHMQVAGYGERTAGKIRLFTKELGEPSGAAWTIRPEPSAAAPHDPIAEAA